MQLGILIFFQKMHSQFLDLAMNLISFMGEAAVPLLVLSLTYWCISRKKGFAALSSLMSALIVAQSVKAVIRAPRPFMVHPDLIEGGRIGTATGYSFPSGHSTTAAAFYSSLAVIGKRRWISIISVLMIILIPVSRLYLGVHWPLDVAAGMILGLFSGLFLTPLFLDLYDDERKFRIFTLTAGTVTLILSAALMVPLDLGRADPVAFSDLMSNSAVASGALLGAYLDRKFLRYDERNGSARKKALRFLAGIMTVAVLAGVFLILPLPHHASEALAFFMAGFAVTFIYPLIGTKAGLFR